MHANNVSHDFRTHIQLEPLTSVYVQCINTT